MEQFASVLYVTGMIVSAVSAASVLAFRCPLLQTRYFRLGGVVSPGWQGHLPGLVSEGGALSVSVIEPHCSRKGKEI
jgi:hypothetical protein